MSNEVTTLNTQIIIDDKGVIKSDPESIEWASYELDSKFSDLHDDVGASIKEFGAGSREHVMSRTRLANEIQKWRNTTYGISPKVYFTHIKASLEPIECANVAERMKNIKKLAEYCKLVGQEGAREAYLKLLVGCARESEIYAIGLNYWIKRDAVNKYKYYVGENNAVKHKDTPVYLKPLRDFPRILPAEVQKKLKEVQDKKVFDDFEILYLDYTKDTKATESKATREKDPILFGIIKELPERLYFITYWEDEHCDMTLEQLIDTISEGSYDFIPECGEITKDYLVKIRKELKSAERPRRGSIGFIPEKKSLMERIKFWK